MQNPTASFFPSNRLLLALSAFERSIQLSLSHFSVTTNQMKRRRIAASNRTTVKSNQLESAPNIPRLVSRNKGTILQVPIEIMVKIFKLAFENFRHLGTRDWRRISMTHVCRHWRDIAITAQELWTDIETWKLTCLEQTAVYLKRSGNSKLTVNHYGNMSNDVALQSLYLALEHLPRIRELRILALWDFPDELRFGLLYNPAPALETFHLDTPSQQTFNFDTLFKGKAPRLIELSLRAHSTTWVNASITQNLKRVCIGSSSSPVRLRDVYFMLSQNPNYEWFWITSVLNDGPSYDPCPYMNTLRLTSLLDLVVLNAEYKQLTRLFNNISFSNDITWDISCADYPIGDNTEADPKRILPYNSSQNTAHILEIKISPNFVSIEADSDESDSFCSCYLDRRKISYMWGGRNISTVESFQFLCSVIKDGFWCSAEILIVEIVASTPDADDLLMSEHVKGDEWESLLKLFPDLSFLTVRHLKSFDTAEVVQTESHHGVISALRWSLSESYDGGIKHEGVLCPKLSELHLCGYDAADRQGMVLLMEALRHRDNCNSGLSELTLSAKEFDPTYCFPNLRVLALSRVAHSIKIVDEDDEDVDLDSYRSYGNCIDESEDIREWCNLGGDWWEYAHNFYYSERDTDEYGDEGTEEDEDDEDDEDEDDDEDD